MKKLTLEERVTRLERAVKNEFILDKIFSKSKSVSASDLKKWLDNLNSTLKTVGMKADFGKNDKTIPYFRITLVNPDDKAKAPMFIVGAKDGDPNNMYCTALIGDKEMARAPKFSLNKDGTKKLLEFIQKFIKNYKVKTATNSSYKRDNGSLRKRFEAVALDGIEIGYLDGALKTLFDDGNLSVNVDSRKMASEGFLTVTVSDDQGAVDYYVQAEDDNRIIVGLGATPRGGDSEELSECDSLTEAAEIIHSDALMQFGL